MPTKVAIPGCDCGAESEGKWANMHGPGCALLKPETPLERAYAGYVALKVNADGEKYALLERIYGLVDQHERICQAIKDLIAEPVYENQKKDDGIAVRFIARMTMLQVAAGIRPGDDPIALDAVRELTLEK